MPILNNYNNPYYYPASYVPPQQLQTPPPAPVQQPQAQIQNGGFVSVRNETEARNYPVGLGTSVTFKDETAPYVYTKTMGFSQLDVPKFDKYKLVKEAPEEPSNLPQNESFDAEPINNAIDDIKSEIESIWGEIDALKEKPVSATTKRASQKKAVIEDDSE